MNIPRSKLAFVFTILLAIGASHQSAFAQLEKLDYKQGDSIEVKFMSEWYEAEVTQILGWRRGKQVWLSGSRGISKRVFGFGRGGWFDIERVNGWIPFLFGNEINVGFAE